jgi:ribA/ribD-fused uncharacterized protein
MSVSFFTTPFHPLDNSSAHAIEFERKLYPTAEHAYQVAKCTSPEGKEAICLARSPIQARKLANDDYKPAQDPQWASKKIEVMEKILRSKLEQHPEVQEALRRTETEQIFQDYPTDFFWGRGKDGTGQNQLGKLWVKIRAELNPSQP